MGWPLQRFQADSCFTLPTCLRIPEEFSKKICKIMICEKEWFLDTCPWLLLDYRQTYQLVTCYRHTALDLTLDYLVAKAKIRERGLQWLNLWELAWSSSTTSLLICNFEKIIQCDFYFCFWFCICISKKKNYYLETRSNLLRLVTYPDAEGCNLAYIGTLPAAPLSLGKTVK